MRDSKIIHVLIVEDEPTLRDVYKTVLTMQGFRVQTASNGVQALNAVKKRPPDVVLLDVLMPEMGGLEFMRNIEIDEFSGTRIIITSNIADQEVIKEMLSLGAHQHVLKSSLTPNALIDMIQKATNAEDSMAS